MRRLLILAAPLAAACAGAPRPAGPQHRVRVQMTQGALPPAVVDDHVCHADPQRDPRQVTLTCVGPGGPALRRALRAAPGVLSAELVD